MPKNNKMKKKVICVGIMMLMIMIFTGCANNQVETRSSVTEKPVQEITVHESPCTAQIVETESYNSTEVSTSTSTAFSENEKFVTTTTFTEVATTAIQPATVETTVTAVVATEAPTSYVETQPMNECYLTHQVVAGNTWYGIAKSYHVTMSDLLAVNNASEDDVIIIGQVINIPNYGWYDESEDYIPASVPEVWEDPSPNYISGTCIAYQSMTYSNTWNNSWKNIVTSATYLDGTVLAPGETFSWFSVMGPCDYSQGYIDSDGYEGNKVVQVPGGGICFTSTNLHMCARSAGMDIVERHDHSMPVWYAARGDEATVSYGSYDLKFTNTTGYTVIFYASTDANGNLTISCYTM